MNRAIKQKDNSKQDKSQKWQLCQGKSEQIIMKMPHSDKGQFCKGKSKNDGSGKDIQKKKRYE